VTICDGILPGRLLAGTVETMTAPALLFDLDGTLVDTAPDLLAALNAVLQAEGRTQIAPATLRQMVGHGARFLIQRAMAATGLPLEGADLLRLTDTFIAHSRDHIADSSVAFAGVEETLSLLKAEGARLAVLTNKPQTLAVPLLRELRLWDYFDFVCGSGRYSYNKPDARVVDHVLQELGAARERAVVIGDSAVDVATARAAAIPVVLLSYGYTPEPAHTLGADAVIDEFNAVPECIGRILGSRGL
jgi:phosphoglycolate phosphatase